MSSEFYEPYKYYDPFIEREEDALSEPKVVSP